MQGAYQHILTDLHGFLGTVIAAINILTTSFARADAIASLFVAALILKAAWGLLRESGRVLLEAAPEGIDLDDVRTHLAGTEHVHDVHDLHVWTLTSNLPTLSAHVVINDYFASSTDTHRRCLTNSRNAWSATSTSNTPPELETSAHTGHEPGFHE